MSWRRRRRRRRRRRPRRRPRDLQDQVDAPLPHSGDGVPQQRLARLGQGRRPALGAETQLLQGTAAVGRGERRGDRLRALVAKEVVVEVKAVSPGTTGASAAAPAFATALSVRASSRIVGHDRTPSASALAPASPTRLRASWRCRIGAVVSAAAFPMATAPASLTPLSSRPSTAATCSRAGPARAPRSPRWTACCSRAGAWPAARWPPGRLRAGRHTRGTCGSPSYSARRGSRCGRALQQGVRHGDVEPGQLGHLQRRERQRRLRDSGGSAAAAAAG